MKLIDLMQKSGFSVQEYTLFGSEDSENQFWHCNIIDDCGLPIAGGFHNFKNVARKISFAEYLERISYKRIYTGTPEIQKVWGIDLIPTGCGFAAGFNQRNAILRSIGEALERWVMSKWIDDHFFIPQENIESVSKTFDKATHWFFNQFDEVRFYSKDVLVSYGNQFCKFKVGFSIALKNGGVYPGSSVHLSSGSFWQHALLESFRHYLLVKNTTPSNSFPGNRVLFFAENGHMALDQIAQSYKNEWPQPQIGFHNHQYFDEGEFYLSRTIIKGWESWHLGPVERFLY